MRQSRPGLADGGRVGQHADGTVDRGEIAVGDVLGGLVADTNLEASGAPVDKLNRALRLEVGNGSVRVLGDNVTAVKQAGGHVLAVARIALDHLVVRLEAGVGNLHDRVGLVGSLNGRDDGGVSDKREVDTGVWDQVGLELVEVDVEGAVEAERGGNGRDNWWWWLVGREVEMQYSKEIKIRTLGNKTVQVLVVGALNAQVPSANVVDGLVVDHEGTVGVLERGVGGEDRVVGLDDRGGDLGGRVDAELELALFAVVDGQTLHEQGAESGTGSATKRVEDEETLETGAVVGDAADLVEDLVNELLADRVVATGVVVGGILLARDHLLGVEEGAVGAGADLVDDVGLQIGVDGAGDVLALACRRGLDAVFLYMRAMDDRAGVGGGVHTSLGEEGAEAMVVVLSLALLGEVAVGLDAVLEAVELWARGSVQGVYGVFGGQGGQGARPCLPWLPCAPSPPFHGDGDAGEERKEQD